MKSKALKNSIGILIFFIIIMAVKLLFFPGKSKAEGGAARAKIELKVNGLILKEQALSDTLIIAGSILPEESTALTFEVSGKITGIFFTEGSYVKTGTKLAKINDADLQAELLKANANKNLAEQREQRAKALLQKDGISKEEYDQAVNSADVARAQIALLKAQIDKTELKAPYDGYIGLRAVSPGQYVTVGTMIANISKTQSVRIEGDVPETYYGLIKNGTSIRFQPTGSNALLPANIYAVDAKVSDDSRSFSFRARAANGAGNIPVGGFAKIFINVQQKGTGFIIPAESMVPDVKGYVAFVMQNGRVAERRIELLRRDAENSYITSGLQAGDTLVVSAIMNMRNNLPVKYGIIKQQ